jgi:trehalose 6-phosphate synthase/phosphatase
VLVKAALAAKYRSQLLIISRDELDYIKGITQKLQGFSMFLQRHPEYLGRVTLLLVASSTPSLHVEDEHRNGKQKGGGKMSHLRTTFHSVIDYEAEVTSLITQINATYGRLDWTPVQYLQKDISNEEYLALLEMADVALITPLRDGWNLMCHNYILCQDIKKSPLIVSEVRITF